MFALRNRKTFKRKINFRIEFDLWWVHSAIGEIPFRKAKWRLKKGKYALATRKLLLLSAQQHTHIHASNKYMFNKTDSYANRVRDINKCNEIQFRYEFQLYCSVAWMKTYAANSIFSIYIFITHPPHTIYMSVVASGVRYRIGGNSNRSKRNNRTGRISLMQFCTLMWQHLSFHLSSVDIRSLLRFMTISFWFCLRCFWTKINAN